MKNVNRDYLVKVDAKTADIVPPRDMKFFITDIYTCNIFFQLIINDTDKSFINAPNENADKYKLMLNVLKPDNTPIENIETTFMYQSGNAFYYVADLIPDYTDVLGIYECELFIDTTINGRSERSTTEPFQYEVEKSIFSNLDEVIEDLPGYPLLDTLATKEYVREAMKNMDLVGYATRDYVNQVVVGGVDLSEYVTDEELNESLSYKANSSHEHNEYATKDYVLDAIVDVNTDGTINLDDYATNEELNNALVNKADVYHTHNEYITDTELTAKDYATKDQIPDSLPADGGNADTVDGYNVWVGSQTQYDAIYTKRPDVIYFIEED